MPVGGRHSEAHLLPCHSDSEQYHVQVNGGEIGQEKKQNSLSTVKNLKYILIGGEE